MVPLLGLPIGLLLLPSLLLVLLVVLLLLVMVMVVVVIPIQGLTTCHRGIAGIATPTAAVLQHFVMKPRLFPSSRVPTHSGRESKVGWATKAKILSPCLYVMVENTHGEQPRSRISRNRCETVLGVPPTRWLATYRGQGGTV